MLVHPVHRVGEDVVGADELATGVICSAAIVSVPQCPTQLKEGDQDGRCRGEDNAAVDYSVFAPPSLPQGQFKRVGDVSAVLRTYNH